MLCRFKAVGLNGSIYLKAMTLSLKQMVDLAGNNTDVSEREE